LVLLPPSTSGEVKTDPLFRLSQVIVTDFAEPAPASRLWCLNFKVREEHEEGEMIEGKFNSRTLANMNVALERVCEKAPHGEDHAVRKRIAKEIIRCASSGKTTLSDLTAAGQRALMKVAVASK
jgi:hypothetical protein